MLTVIFAGSARMIFSIGLVAMPPVAMSILACCILPALPRSGDPCGLGWSALIVVVLDAVETILYLWKLICVRWWKSFAVGFSAENPCCFLKEDGCFEDAFTKWFL